MQSKKLHLITFALLLSSTLFSQIDCKQYLSCDTDRMTGGVTVCNKNRIFLSHVAERGISIHPFKDLSNLDYSIRQKIILSIKVIDPAQECIDGGYIQILFTDGSRLKIPNHASYNCQGTVVYSLGLYSQIDKDRLKELTTKKMKAIRVDTYLNFEEEDFTDEQAAEFINELSCLWAWKSE